MRYAMIAVALFLGTIAQANAGCTAVQREPYENVIASLQNQISQYQEIYSEHPNRAYLIGIAGFRDAIQKYENKIATLCADHVEQSPSTEELVQQWELYPEHDDLKTMCADQLTWAEAIGDAEKQGATTNDLMRWAEREAESYEKKLPSEPLLGVGTLSTLSKLILHSYWDAPVYKYVNGGFPQWAYRSCLKNKPLYN